MNLIKLWDADLTKAYALQNTFKQDENGFINAAFGYTFDEFIEYVDLCHRYSLGIGLPEHFVPATVFILVDDEGNYVGLFNLRHCLNDVLANGAGHIGYGISPTYRGKGYATKGLALVLQEANEHGIDEVYMSVNKDNIPSLKAQQRNGAAIHHEDDTKYYTRVYTTRSNGAEKYTAYTRV